MKRFGLVIALLVLVSVVADVASVYAGGQTGPAPANLVVGRPAKGMYCADPAGWINAGYRIYVWGNATPIKAQAFDAEGYLTNTVSGITWVIQGTGQTGTMTLTDTVNKVYTASPTSLAATNIFTGDSNMTYSADGKTFSGVIRRWNSKCDGCHSVPPPHAIANAATTPGVSTCRTSTCHPYFGAKMMQSHALRVPVAEQTTSDGCYRCHPGPCYGGIHLGKFPNDSIGCVTCHGTEIDALNGQMKVPGQLGFPKCQDCHVSGDPKVQIVPYATNTGVEYKSSVGHGRKRDGLPKVLCITCHNSMHMEENPLTKWGTTTNNNCDKCHVNKPTNRNMGPVCGNCHKNSFNPHFVIK